MRRIAVIADLHCGHKFALTPPDWQGGKERAFQARLWDGYVAAAATVGRVDMLVVNGDAVDGKGPKSGGNELITADRVEQAEMAARCVEEWDAKRVVFLAGTPYHTGCNEDWERVAADKLGAEFYDAKQFRLEGVVFDFRHHIASAGMPHTQGGALAAELIWARDNADYGYVVPDVIVRSHRHRYWKQETDSRLMVVTPGLQARSTYGRRRCRGVPSLGTMCFSVDGDSVGCDRFKIFRGDLASPPLSVD